MPLLWHFGINLNFEILLVVTEFVLGNFTWTTVRGSICFVIHILARIKMLASLIFFYLSY